ncbi:LysR family transcriptional regulator [Altererythrobacter indicus]|uniref:LysR family transcriptional regulator n=1 Tax=Altericroceibacterium indicum TaxID=374177 RepID=A0A845AAN8_9SPHN|nr:LysR family transcriptional regulator [Altericroceibacterium indicum]MXP26567.1 LysR family transcriptional regulator [Altericroceibacterium indicum]
MRLDNFDLNLLVAFDVLMQEQSVTKAANRLNVTQSAMSASLKRLRESFQDDILAQHGKKLLPTPFAMALQPEIAEKIFQLRVLIARQGRFDPQHSERHFRIAASDYITTVLLAPLVNALGQEAPGIAFTFELPGPTSQVSLANGELDLLLTPEMFVHPDHPCELVLEEQHVTVGWTGNPLLTAPISRKDFTDAGHVGVSVGRKFTFAEEWFKSQGIERRIEVRAPSFIQAPFLVPGTMRFCVMHESLARLMAERLPLRILGIPFPIPPMREMMQFHATREADPGLLWLRKRITQAASSQK